MNKSISIKELALCTIYLLIGFVMAIYFGSSQVVDERTLFTGAIMGALLVLLSASSFAMFRVARNKKLDIKPTEE